MKDKIDGIVKACLETDKEITLDPKTNLLHLGLDSLKQMELLMMFEEEFDIEIDLEEFTSYITMKRIYKYIKKQCTQKK